MKTRTKMLLALGIPALILGLTEWLAWSGGYFQWFYVLPIALLAPWLLILRFAGAPVGHRMLMADGLALTLAAVRIIGPFVPASGHVLFLVYSGVTVPNRWYRLAAVLIFLEVAWLKLLVWGEPGSFVGGLAAALGLILLAGRPPRG